MYFDDNLVSSSGNNKLISPKKNIASPGMKYTINVDALTTPRRGPPSSPLRPDSVDNSEDSISKTKTQRHSRSLGSHRVTSPGRLLSSQRNIIAKNSSARRSLLQPYQNPGLDFSWHLIPLTHLTPSDVLS